MYRIINLFISICFVLILTCTVTQAQWPWSRTQELVEINGSSYTADDYMHWWENWSGKDKKASHDIQPFIEWNLMVQEALAMEIDQNPFLRREMDVFLKVRSRLQFKYETVDSKIHISKQALRDQLEADYNPVSFITLLYFTSEEKANEAHQSLEDKTFSFEELRDLPESGGGPHQTRQRLYYPMNFKNNPALSEIFGKLPVGEVSQVFPVGKLFGIGRLDKQEAPDETFYKDKRRDTEIGMHKEESSRLTSELIDFLWQKYEVQVDEELFGQVNVDMAGEIFNQPIATTNKSNIPVSLLVKDIRKEHSYRQIDEWSEEQRLKLYRGLLRGMIIEYLITWETSEHHYENEAPLKFAYEYHKEKSMIRELEKLLLKPKVSLSDDEILKYYQEHIDEYKNPDLVTISTLIAEKGQVERVWQEVSRGSDFFEVANRHDIKLFPLKEVDVEQLSPEMGAVVQKLGINEVSSPFILREDRFALIKLLNRTDGETKSLESVKKSIIDKLRPVKFQQAKNEYIEKLLAHSDIEVNQKAWNKLIADQKK